jgi:HEAT repeat protein
MAVALATLGQKEGFAALQSTCKTNEGLAMLRLSAAGDLMQLHDDSCLSDLLDFIREQQAAPRATLLRDNFLVVALSYFTAYELQHPPSGQLRGIRDVGMLCVADQSPEVRLQSARVIARYGDSDSVRGLQKAVDAEQDSFHRPRMLEALKALEERERESPKEKN